MSDKPHTATPAVSQEAREAAESLAAELEVHPDSFVQNFHTACVAYADRECAALNSRVYNAYFATSAHCETRKKHRAKLGNFGLIAPGRKGGK